MIEGDRHVDAKLKRESAIEHVTRLIVVVDVIQIDTRTISFRRWAVVILLNCLDDAVTSAWA